jgi:hypothetical protein
MLNLLIILNIILAAAASVFTIKRLLIEYKWSKAIIKNIIMSICIMASLFLSFSCIYSGFIIDEDKEQLEYELTKSEGITINNVSKSELVEGELKTLSERTKEVAIYTIVAYLSYLFSSLIYRSILNEDAKIKPEGKWNLKNYR